MLSPSTSFEQHYQDIAPKHKELHSVLTTLQRTFKLAAQTIRNNIVESKKQAVNPLADTLN